MDEAKQPAFVSLLERSAAFEAAIVACFPAGGYILAIADQKHDLVVAACRLCIEHASVLRAAFAIAAPNTGAAVLRLQYEALLRAAWLMYAANPSQIDKLTQTLDLEAERTAKNLPGYMEMLQAVVEKAPRGLATPIAEFNEFSRHALNSFVHSGIHPLRRSREGFPSEIGKAVLRSSNGLLHLAYRMLAILSGSQRRMEQVTNLYREFTDCVPIAMGSANQGRAADS